MQDVEFKQIQQAINKTLCGRYRKTFFIHFENLQGYYVSLNPSAILYLSLKLYFPAVDALQLCHWRVLGLFFEEMRACHSSLPLAMQSHKSTAEVTLHCLQDPEYVLHSDTRSAVTVRLMHWGGDVFILHTGIKPRCCNYPDLSKDYRTSKSIYPLKLTSDSIVFSDKQILSSFFLLTFFSLKNLGDLWLYFWSLKNNAHVFSFFLPLSMKTRILSGLHYIFLPIEKTGLFLGGGGKKEIQVQ